MPAKLSEPQVKISWRIEAEDLRLLNALFPGKVNDVARNLIHRACERWRAQGFTVEMAQGEITEA